MAGSQSRASNFKVVLLGEGCVGKTSLVLRYVEDKFNDKHYTTLQVSLCYVLSVFLSMLQPVYEGAS